MKYVFELFRWFNNFVFFYLGNFNVFINGKIKKVIKWERVMKIGNKYFLKCFIVCVCFYCDK